uniref:Uncharacterized protein n=1 Tax=Anolis carolinensis TaxID=28377 RepID=A0A803TI01_ANOCA
LTKDSHKPHRINGKKPALTIQPTSNVEESYTVAHEENVRFVYEGKKDPEDLGSSAWFCPNSIRNSTIYTRG